MDNIIRPKSQVHIRVSIRKKVLVSILSVVLLFGSIQVYVVFHIVRQSLKEEFSKKGIMMARYLAYQLEEAVLYDDVTKTQQILWQWKSDASEHGYALVVSSDGRVIASTFTNGVPIGLAKANMPAGSRHQFIRVQSNKEVYQDVAVPLMSGAAGWVRLGLHEKSVQVPQRKILTLLLAMVLFFVILGVIGAILFSRLITLPVKKLVHQFETVDLDSEPVRTGIKTGDELEVLAASFEEMTARLQESHRQLTEANRKGFETQKLAALGLLASGIAHEISNPLAGIQLGLKRIAKEPEKSDQILRYIPPMMSSFEHMQHVIEQTQLFASPRTLIISSVNLPELIEHTLVLVNHKLTKQNIEVRKKIDDEARLVWADSQSLTQILVNLVLNAADSMREGGVLSVETTRQNGRIQISVSDTGDGIKEENYERIWEPFFTTKEVGKGTGLGLSVTWSLVKTLSGKIDFDSEIGKGTRFRVSLPINPEESDESLAAD